MSVRAASSHNTAEPKYDMLVSSMTCIAHNSLVFYSCIASMQTRLGCHCWEMLHGKQKKYVRTCNDLYIEMHSNQGRVCLRTLVDQKRKRLLNAVDVVERLHDTIDHLPNVRHLRVQHTFSSMMSLELLIQQRVEGEFHQHAFSSGFS